MKTTLILLLSTFSANLLAQNKANKELDAIVAEGKMLYRSEMASWYGTDLFLEKYSKRENVGGYFSYADGENTKCVFFAKNQETILGTITFGKEFDTKTATVDLSERYFSKNELDFYAIRKAALKEISSDTLFKTYEKTSLNLIPIISGKERKVYVLTGPQENGVVIFGNDYLLTFDKKNQVASKKALHKNIIPVSYNSEEPTEGTIHSHAESTGELITATDVCTLMLYGKYTGWKTHNVISEKYLNVWNCETNTVFLLPTSSMKKIIEGNEPQK